jgi:Ca2+/H+ antiporter, TMEM165/GDT1 family
MNPDSCRRLRFLIPVAVLAFVGLLSFAVYALWNGVLTDVLPVKAITYWQALGLLVLSKILFGGFPGRRRGCGRGRRARMLSKHWESLNPEQREKLRDEMRHKFGDWPRPWCDTKHPDQEGPGKPTSG